MQYVDEAGVTDVMILCFKARLIEQVAYSITKDTRLWADSYVCKPSQFSILDSIFYTRNKKCRF